MPDAVFADPRLAAIYDDVDGDRNDLDHYEAIVAELDARRVLDIGCGTGEFACRLARRGLAVTGIDPASSSLDIARSKPGADAVTWLLGDACVLPAITTDVVTMTGNVAQVFLTNHDWRSTLLAASHALRPDGHLVFETRDPSARGWEEWTRATSTTVTATTSGPVECWVDVTSVKLPFVSFRWTYRFLDIGDVLVSDSTLIFRSNDEIAAILSETGFVVDEVRDAPDRSDREFVFIAHAIQP